MFCIISEITLAIVGVVTVIWGYLEFKKDPEEFFGVK